MTALAALASLSTMVLANPIVVPEPIEKDYTIGYLEIDGAISEKPGGDAGFFGGSEYTTLRGLVRTFEFAASGAADVDAIVLRLRETALSTADAEELRAAIEHCEEEGVRVHVFAESYGATELIMASAASEIILQEGGSIFMPGVYIEEMFFADTLEWAGIDAQFVQVGDYKGASEAFVNSKPSQAWEENISRLMDELYEAMREPIMKGRDLSERELDRAMEEAIFASGETSIEIGLIDAEMDRLELDAHLADHYGEDFEYELDLYVAEDTGAPDFESMGMFEVFAMFQELMTEGVKQRTSRDTIAVVHIDGAIVDGTSSSGGFTGSSNVGSLTIRETLAELADDPNIKGVVIRIESPGGSATASESIWQGFNALREDDIPVVASVGSMAASGGYYIAVSADQIHVDPSSIVGSIGVVAGKFVMADLYDKLHLRPVPRVRGPRAAMLSSVLPWDDDDIEFIRDRMVETYDLFTERVADARPDANMSKVAEGRLFAGTPAVEVGLADKVMGLEPTIDELADELGLSQGSYDVFHYPEPPSIAELLEEAFPAAGAPMSSSK
ncbi:MAG: S49 family peptidase, partial [Planctomycetota bacterium]